MKRFTKSKKVLFGLSVSLVLAMAIGSFALGEVQTPVTPQVALMNDYDTGAFDVEGGTAGTDYDYANGVLSIHPQSSDTSFEIKNKDPGTETQDRIEITAGPNDAEKTVNITLDGVNIDRTNEAEAKAALEIADDATFNVNITLADKSENTLKGKMGAPSSTNVGSAGIQKNGDTGVGTLTITGSTGENSGKLEAYGGYYSAGIGSGADGTSTGINTSNITITGGNVTAEGGSSGAGIGGGSGGNGSNITISGGNVTANGGYGAAGIGGGSINSHDGGEGSDINISGGEVNSTGGYGGAGIGGGMQAKGTGITISGGVVTATGREAGAGIGGGGQANGEKIKITGGVIKATGGLYMTYPAAGIGGGGTGSASDNKLDGDAVVMAASGGENKDALEGFENNLTKGITVTGVVTDYTTDPYTIDWEKGELYGTDVAITEDTTFPVNFKITSTAALTIGKNADGKEATISMEEGKKLTVKGSLTNNGVIDIPAENIKCSGNGKITTLLNYDPQGGSIKTNDDNYIIYQDASGVKKYENLPGATKEGCDFDGWYAKAGGQGTKVEEGNSILLNEHILYANWIENPTPTPPTPTPPGPEPQPTPPGPEPGPEPTPDPSANPDGGDGSGSGSSSKTSDPFMGGMALALLGVATTGAILTRKLR